MFRPVRRRRGLGTQQKTATIREFNGGWNVADNDLNLSSNFAKVFDNVSRLPDGSVGLRYGTKLYADLQRKTTFTGDLVDNPLTTTAASAVVTVAHIAHGMITGHEATLSGLATTDGIPDTELNATHVITRIDNDSYTIIVTTTATAGLTGGGTSGSYSYGNQNLATDIIHVDGFSGKAFALDTSGNISLLDAQANSVIIWSTNIANKLHSTAGWSSGLTFASTTVFGQVLKVHNGIDKPIEIDLSNANPCRYMEDPGSGSNANTPVGRYGVTVGNYHVVAGMVTTPSGDDGSAILSISGAGTPNTFLGDASTDAIEFDVAKHVAIDNPIIRGIAEFRKQLIVFFDNITVPITLGGYSGSTHVPVVGEPVKSHGSTSHASIQDLGNDLLAADTVGVPSFARAFVDSSLRPKRTSQLIDPQIQAMLSTLSTASLEDRVFSVYNLNQGQYMLFVPNNDSEGSTTETTVFVYTIIEELRVKAWARFKGWNFRAVGTSTFGRVLLAKDREIYIYGTENDPYYADYIDDPSLAIPANGVDISFDWEFPWADFDQRALLKHLQYIKFDTKGTGPFKVRMYVDNITRDVNDNDVPAIEMDFVGGDSLGYGEGDQVYGGGRNVGDERLWEFPAKGMLFKLRVSGTSSSKIQFVTFVLYYLLGEIRR